MQIVQVQELDTPPLQDDYMEAYPVIYPSDLNEAVIVETTPVVTTVIVVTQITTTTTTAKTTTQTKASTTKTATEAEVEYEEVEEEVEYESSDTEEYIEEEYEESDEDTSEDIEETVEVSDIYDITYDEYIILCNAVGQEYGQDYVPEEEKALVIEVIMNRVKSGKYPNSIYAVVTQSGQFDRYEDYIYLDGFSYKVTESVVAAVDLYFSDPSAFSHGYHDFWGDGEWNYFS